ncbi:head GIN domain-containing protein [Croceibacterium aestuarii]|uniref:head GIN domain-containing protein n=1 Tax=Croceibacterium aestuarii TaxID=3064139 RepID=UPI00272E7180|nr:head GIN domain-containing protein [Croceibacterium sp. D39]
MSFKKVLKALGPVVAIAIAGGLAACDNADFTVNGKKGVPLADLDLTGKTPSEVALLGPDTVDVRTGETLAIEVEGDDAVKDLLRFVLDDESLAIMRAKGDAKGTAAVTVTMPSPRKLTVGGSGKLTAAELTGDAEANVLGSGSLEVAGISADKLSANVAGSGSMKASGKTGELNLDVLGSGSAKLGGLSADKADVTIAGSGGATFASDGEVEAEILGSGSVTVRGDARCKVHSVGSGSLVCERNTETVDD